MKKLLSFALILMVCCTSALLFAGCDSNPKTIKINEAKSPEKIEFTVFENNEDDPLERTEQEQYEDARLAALATIYIDVYNDDKIEEEAVSLDKVEQSGGRVFGFSLKYEGTRTATVTYQETSTTFKYTVKAAS